MKKLIRFCLVVSLSASIAFYGCRPDPQSDIRAAQHAMEKAKGFHSEILAPAEWKEAIQAWEEAQAVQRKGEYPREYFRKAKALFDKTIAAAEAKGLEMQKEISDIQKTINESYLKVKATLKEGRVKPNIVKELDPVLKDVAIESSTIKDLIMHFEYTQAKEKVLETQKKMFDAETILYGKKP
jgi:hypothetical protein